MSAKTAPEGRYGPADPRAGWRAPAWLWALAAVIVFVALSTFWWSRIGNVDLDGERKGYDVLSDSEISVTFSLTRKSPEKPALCLIRGLHKDGSEIGRAEVIVPPSDQRDVAITGKVPTSRPPAVGDLYGCTYDVPAWLTQK
jgi:hypothetical protein